MYNADIYKRWYPYHTMNAVDTKAVKSDKLNVKITEREDEMTGLSTLCYIEKDNKYLMLHRIKKKNDVNEGKWIGVGGHFEADESLKNVF